MSEFVVVMITAPSPELAEKIGRALVESRLAACSNIIPGLQSIFNWQGQVQSEAEVLMLLKTRAELFPEVVRRVQEMHTYEVPEIIALPILAGSDSYMAWLNLETQPAQVNLRNNA